jgi:hypothetical protein
MKKNDVGGACGAHGRARKPLRRLRHRRKDGIRMDVRRLAGWVCIKLAQGWDRWWELVNVVMNL